MVTDKQIDDAIMGYLSTAGGRWRKVAMVYVRVEEALGAAFPEDKTGNELFDRRIAALVVEGKLVAQGNIKLWRFSEVRWP